MSEHLQQQTWQYMDNNDLMSDDDCVIKHSIYPKKKFAYVLKISVVYNSMFYKYVVNKY